MPNIIEETKTNSSFFNEQFWLKISCEIQQWQIPLQAYPWWQLPYSGNSSLYEASKKEGMRINDLFADRSFR